MPGLYWDPQFLAIPTAVLAAQRSDVMFRAEAGAKAELKTDQCTASAVTDDTLPSGERFKWFVDLGAQMQFRGERVSTTGQASPVSDTYTHHSHPYGAADPRYVHAGGNRSAWYFNKVLKRKMYRGVPDPLTHTHLRGPSEVWGTLITYQAQAAQLSASSLQAYDPTTGTFHQQTIWQRLKIMFQAGYKTPAGGVSISLRHARRLWAEHLGHARFKFTWKIL